MSSPAYFSFPRQWNAQDLADAVPRRLRLSQMVDFDAVRQRAAANGVPRIRPTQAYLPVTELPRMFRIC